MVYKAKFREAKSMFTQEPETVNQPTYCLNELLEITAVKPELSEEDNKWLNEEPAGEELI